MDEEELTEDIQDFNAQDDSNPGKVRLYPMAQLVMPESLDQEGDAAVEELSENQVEVITNIYLVDLSLLALLGAYTIYVTCQYRK